jgi:hypothetical protein
LVVGPVSAHDGEAETVTKNFEAAIPTIPGKSLIAVEVDYAPGAIHSISRNASKTEPAKLLAVFVLDTNDNTLTTPIK